MYGMHVSSYVCMHVWVYVCMYVYTYVCTYACLYMYDCMRVCGVCVYCTCRAISMAGPSSDAAAACSTAEHSTPACTHDAPKPALITSHMRTAYACK